MIRVLTVCFLLALPALARAECAELVSSRSFGQMISEGDGAFADLDEATFYSARARARNAIPCLKEPLDTAKVAAWHRLDALGHFLERDHGGTVRSFRSVLTVAPGYLLPESLAPEDHPLRIDFEAAQGLGSGPSEALPPPADGSLLIDGVNTLEVPLDRPYLFQRLDASGMVAQSTVVDSGQAAPIYEAGRVRGGSRTGTTAKASRGGFKVNGPLMATAGVAAIASGGLYMLARGASQNFWDPSTADEELAGLRSRTNLYQGLSLGAGLVAVGAGTGAVVAGSF